MDGGMIRQSFGSYTFSRKKKMKKSKWNLRAVNRKDSYKGFDNGKNNLRKNNVNRDKGEFATK